MPLPKPQLGQVISYAYLWHHERQAGQEEGRKDRPCVVVLAVDRGADGLIVTVVPVTHLPPNDTSLAVELPVAIKRHLDLDGERSWVMLHEGNRFAWPGYDLRPVPGTTDRYEYGLLPPRFFSVDDGTLQNHLDGRAGSSGVARLNSFGLAQRLST